MAIKSISKRKPPRKLSRACCFIGIIVWSFVFATSSPTSGQDQVVANPLRANPSMTPTVKIEDLIAQLGAAEFATREYATDAIWKIGLPAKAALEKATQNPNREVRARAGRILHLLSLGIESDVSPDIPKLIQLFDESSRNIRSKIIDVLLGQNRFELALRLIEQQPDRSEIAELYEDAISFNDLLFRLAREKSWSEIEFLLRHPLINQFEPLICVYYRLADGSLDTMIAETKTELSGVQNEGDKLAVDRIRLRLAALYRVQQDYDQALEQGKLITDESLRSQLIQTICLEAGQWNQLLSKIDDESNFTAAQIPVLAFFADSEEKQSSGLSQLIDQFNQSTQDLTNEEKESSQKVVAAVALATMDWNTASKFINSENRADIFELLVSLQKYDEAFSSIGLGPTFTERTVWIQRRVRNLRSLENKIQRQEQKGEDSQLAEEDLEQTWNLCSAVVGHLGSLGYTNEALYHFRTLFEETKNFNVSQEFRTDVIEGMLELGAFAEVWKLVERDFSELEHKTLIYSLFPYKSETAGFWYDELAKRYADPVIRLKVLANLLNSPLGTDAAFNIETELAVSREYYRKSIAMFEYEVSQVLKFHGRVELSNNALVIAADLGNEDARKELSIRLLNDKRYAKAEPLLQRSFNERPNSVNAMLMGEMLRGLGNDKQAALFETMGFVYWHDSYRTSTILNRFNELDRLGRITDFLKIYVASPGSSSVSNERYRNALAMTQLESSSDAATNNLQIEILNLLQGPTTGIRRYSFWSESIRQIELNRAKAEIDRGQIQTAWKRLERYSDFREGDPVVGEELIPRLEKSRHQAEADELFLRLDSFYADVLNQFPASLIHHNNYAWICATSKRNLDRARRHGEVAVSARPFNPSYLDTLAEILFLEGDPVGAAELSKRCVQLNPNKLHYQRQRQRFDRAATTE